MDTVLEGIDMAIVGIGNKRGAGVGAEINKSIKRMSRRIRTKIEAAAKAIAIELVYSTNVDSGLAAANWQVSTKAVPTKFLDFDHFGITSPGPYPRGVKAGQPPLISDVAAIKIATDWGTIKAGDTIVWYNNVPYSDNAFKFLDIAILNAKAKALEAVKRA